MRDFVQKCVDRLQEDWPLYWARFAYVFWQIASKLILGVVYLAIIAEGFRVLVPVLGRKLYRLPLLGWMQDYEGTYQLDMASLMSLFMLMAVVCLWDRLLTLWFDERIAFDDRLRDLNHRDKFVLFLGVIVLMSDCVLFFVAVTELTWGGSTFSMTALFATAAYVSVLVFSIYVAISLREKIMDLIPEETDEPNDSPLLCERNHDDPAVGVADNGMRQTTGQNGRDSIHA